MRRLLPVSAALLLLILPFTSARGAGVARFSFGTPESATRAGFIKVTPGDAFTPARGYGFSSIRGLTARDRGGAKVERPQDEYTAGAYGAYRTTSELTSAFIEGTGDSAFLVALPDGEYTVWLIASDAWEDPPLFQVWANGAKKLDARIPRRSFVLMEPFRARAAGGSLRIELKGRHGWLLNALLIGKEGPELAEAVAGAERHIFFLADEELPNWKERPSTSPNPPLALTPAEKRNGYVVFPADYTERIGPAYTPPRAMVDRPMTTFAALGEFEPATFCVSATRDLGQVTVRLSEFAAERGGRGISPAHVTVGVVRFAPKRVTGEGPKGEYEVVPERIEPAAGRACLVPAGRLKQWWLTVRVPPNTPPGRYRMAVTVRPAKAPPTVLEWRLRVLPFHLIRPKDRHWGSFLESFPPVGGLRGPESRGRNTPTEMDRLAHADIEDFRNHGFDVAIFGPGFGVKETPDGGFRYDISALARTLDYWKAMGAGTPVAVAFEYTCRELEYAYAEPGREHVPGTFSPKARRAIVGLVRHIRDEAKRRGWPQILFYPIDEPGNNKTANRMAFAENVLDMVHEVPGCRTATTVGAGDVQRLGSRVDVRIYAYSGVNREKALRDARAGHPFWFYENGMFYGHSTLASRTLTGFEFLRSGAGVASAWGFDCTYGNPHNDFDSGHRDWNVLYPGVDRSMPTIYWELCREGVDDCRYVATLREEIRRARKRGQAAAARRAESVLAPLIAPDARSIDQPVAFGRYRWRIAREILSLRGEKQPVLPFAAAARSADGPEKLGPNRIADPSFEAGPQADGFPSAGYHIADPYARPEAKPVNALVVTDEAAHSGRYSLKWDFGQAEGKGFLYGRDRWLIVNVQVPREDALALRGKRVKVGFWFRLGGGSCVPSMVLREAGKGEHLGGLGYSGGLEDPAVWNHFATEGQLSNRFDSLDIHIPCVIPEDREVARKSIFFIDDVSLREVEEPPLSVSTPLDEYYIGERLPWSAGATAAGGELKMTLSSGARRVGEQARPVRSGSAAGGFATRGLKPGLYTLRAVFKDGRGVTQAARRQVILAPDPFEWTK